MRSDDDLTTFGDGGSTLGGGSTEYSSTSWFGRLGKAISGVVIGGILFIASFPLLFWNEGRAVHRARDLTEGETLAIVLDTSKPSPESEQKLVMSTGQAASKETLEDKQFSITAEHAIRLNREVETYQWKEHKETRKKRNVGGSETQETHYTYQKVWAHELIPSANFHQASQHRNPTSKAVADHNERASVVSVGEFELTPALVDMIPAKTKIDVTQLPENKLPEAWEGRLHVVNGGYYLGKNPESPEIGDTRITFLAALPQNVSWVAKQVGKSFEPFQTSGGRSLYELRVGQMSKAEFFEQLKKENTILTWVLRFVGWLIMFVGIVSILSPIQVLFGVIPLLEDIAGWLLGAFAALMALSLTLFTIAIGWITYRPMLGIGLIVVGVLSMLLIRRLRPQQTHRVPPPIPSR